MKYKFFILICVCLLVGCHQKASNQGTNSKPTLQLKSRIQVGYNTKFDYRECIQEVKDNQGNSLIEEVEVSDVDTSKIGSQKVHFTVTGSSHQSVTKTMIVDVVHLSDQGIYSPLEVEPNVVDNPDKVTVLVNKVNQIPDGYTPNDLEPVIDNKNQKLRREANAAYTEFYQAAKKKGIEIYSISGYRTNDTQKLYWNNQVKVFGEEYASLYSAYPRRSEHQLGLAIDVSYKTTGDRLSESVASSEIGKFIVSDAYLYGFILRYPKDKVSVTNYAYEPWHMRYVGVELATQLHLQNITLEEYYQ